MSLLEKLQSLPGFKPSPPRRKTAQVSGTIDFLEHSRLIAALIFIITVASIVLISFVGVNNASLPVLPNQLASVRIAASASFNYESEEKTRIALEQMRNRVPPVYRLEMSAIEAFDTNIRGLLAALEHFEMEYPAGAPSPRRQEALAELTEAFNLKGPYRATPDDVAALLNAGSAKERLTIVANAVLVLREIYNEGVHDGRVFSESAGSGALTVFRIRKPTGDVTPRPVQSVDEALRFLRINLAAEGTAPERWLPLFRLFSNGITPNLVYDADTTRRIQNEAIKNFKPVVVTVEQGQTIIEPNTRVSAEQYEMLEAHRRYQLSHKETAFNEGLQLFGRMLLVLAMLIASVLYIRLEDRETIQRNSRLALLALVVIVNLALVRLTNWIGELTYFMSDMTAASLLPYLAPTALAPLIVAILIDTGSAMFMALLISLFTSVIYGQRLDLLVLTFMASMVGIFCCRQIRNRSKVVSAAGLGGLTVAAFALLIGFIDHLPFLTITKQMAAGLGTGLLTGIIVVGILPVLEGLFKRTTDITLLELSDYNHPMLRLMQMEAPGTYHHSLVVSQLAENAANAIGANPLVARVCALFHDIGKTKKPEYFTENQRERANPHDENNPSLSALIIKAHVKDGVDLALKHKLPRMVIDVIQQHHGTTLIRYFFQRARGEKRPPVPGQSAVAAPRQPEIREGATAPGLEPVAPCETTYRYDGPKPQTKEAAIIHLADAIEAASRSLRKLTPQHLGELIDQIFHERIEDGQLDEAPITFEELSKIKSSFTFTLLNMLHSRVSYYASEDPAAPTKTQQSGS